MALLGCKGRFGEFFCKKVKNFIFFNFFAFFHAFYVCTFIFCSIIYSIYINKADGSYKPPRYLYNLLRRGEG